MYSLDTMAKLNSVAAVKAQLKKTPLRIVNHTSDVRRSPDYSGVNISQLASAAGLNVIDTYFVDSSGFGSPGEPAMTFPAFEKTVNCLLSIAGKHNHKLYSALTGVGQFQVYVTILTDGKAETYGSSDD